MLISSQGKGSPYLMSRENWDYIAPEEDCGPLVSGALLHSPAIGLLGS